MNSLEQTTQLVIDLIQHYEFTRTDNAISHRSN